jgi:hypothetical protein
MNDRIKELVKQAGLDDDMFPIDEWDNPELEKFAELIIQECVKILVTSEGNENTSDAIWKLGQLGVNISNILDDIGDY